LQTTNFNSNFYPSFCQTEAARFPLDGILWNYVFVTIISTFQSGLNSGKNSRPFTGKSVFICYVYPVFWPLKIECKKLVVKVGRIQRKVVIICMSVWWRYVQRWKQRMWDTRISSFFLEIIPEFKI
jgi:hypothetical protein